MAERISRAGKLIHKMSCERDCACGACGRFIDELLPRMSDYKRQYHATLSQLQHSKRVNANLNDRATHAEAKVKRLETYIERLEEDLSDIEAPPTIDEDDDVELNDWKIPTSGDEDAWQGSDFTWEESDVSEDDGW